MPERILFPEFRDELEPTNYPFADFASRTAESGYSIDRAAFLDASLYPVGGTYGLYISSIVITARAITIYLSDGRSRDLCSAAFDALQPPATLVFQDSYGRPAGVIVSTALQLAQFSTWPVGTHTFKQAATEFCASCVIPTPEVGVRGILTENGELLTGDVWIVGENGITVRELESGKIRVDVIGDPLFVRKECDPIGLFEPPIFVTHINNCPAGSNGDYRIDVGGNAAPDTIVRIVPIEDGLRFEAIGKPIQRRHQ